MILHAWFSISLYRSDHYTEVMKSKGASQQMNCVKENLSVVNMTIEQVFVIEPFSNHFFQYTNDGFYSSVVLHTFQRLLYGSRQGHFSVLKTTP